ncbi:MAG TPA: hypothetical protein VGT04_16385 [Acidobacteriaceae bacterium]|nr:hypothetical protein [Acidobacteriaceae bacterium]
MEQTTAVFPLCSLTKSDGSRCTGAALPGMNFCFQHIGGRLSDLRAASAYSPRLDLVHAATREAIQHNLSTVALAFSDGKIDNRTANTYFRIYRTAEQNFTRWERANKNNPEKQMLPLSEGAPCLAETWDEDANSTAPEGGPCKRSLSGGQATTTDVIPTEESAAGVPADRSSSVGWEANEAEGPALNTASTTSDPNVQDQPPTATRRSRTRPSS